MATKVKKRKDRQEEHAQAMGLEYDAEVAKKRQPIQNKSKLFKSPKDWNEDTWKWFLFGISLLLLAFIFKFGQ